MLVGSGCGLPWWSLPRSSHLPLLSFSSSQNHTQSSTNHNLVADSSSCEFYFRLHNLVIVLTSCIHLSVVLAIPTKRESQEAVAKADSGIWQTHTGLNIPTSSSQDIPTQQGFLGVTG
jgi:hypothetical protein